MTKIAEVVKLKSGYANFVELKSAFESAVGIIMEWVRMLAYITGTVDQELPLRNEYLRAVLYPPGEPSR